MSEYPVKAAVIGGGLGGLSVGAILAKNGVDVTVLERGSQPGGCLQCFRRGDAKWETGMHYIGSIGPGEMFAGLMRWLGLDKLPLVPLDPSGYEVVKIGGREYRLANTRQAFVDTLAADFPESREQLANYYDTITSTAKASSVILGFQSASVPDTIANLDTQMQLRSIDEVIAELISDSRLRDVLAGNLPLYAGRKGVTPFSLHAFIQNFYSSSAWRVAGGSDLIAKTLVQNIKASGGRVITSAEAAEIVCDDTRATGVRLASGKIYEADYIISTIHPAATLNLTSSPLLRLIYRRRVEEMDNTPGVFSVHLKFKPGTVPYMAYNYYSYPYGSPWGCEDYTDEDWPRGYLYMHHCPAGSHRWARTGVLLSYMRMSELSPWLETRVGRRGEDYLAFKRCHANRLIEALLADRPQLEGCIEGYETSTPLTYRDYTGTPGGSIYGIAHDAKNPASTRVSHRTRIPNLFLAGQNVNSHGLLGVLVGSIMVCSEIVGHDTIRHQLITANSSTH